MWREKIWHGARKDDIPRKSGKTGVTKCQQKAQGEQLLWFVPRLRTSREHVALSPTLIKTAGVPLSVSVCHKRASLNKHFWILVVERQKIADPFVLPPIQLFF